MGQSAVLKALPDLQPKFHDYAKHDYDRYLRGKYAEDKRRFFAQTFVP